MQPKVPKMYIARYSAILSLAIDEGLAILGELPMQAIYGALETDFGMRKADIPSRFAEFSRIMRESMGSSADSVLQFIVDVFYHELRAGSEHGKDLDESIAHVGMILSGDLVLSGESDKSGQNNETIPYYDGLSSQSSTTERMVT